jgi:hypothetical protein
MCILFVNITLLYSQCIVQKTENKGSKLTVSGNAHHKNMSICRNLHSFLVIHYFYLCVEHKHMLIFTTYYRI